MNNVATLTCETQNTLMQLAR